MTSSSPTGSDAWIVDASVAAQWFLPIEREPEAAAAREAIGRLAMRTTTLALYEVGNALTLRSGWDHDRVGVALELLIEICGAPLDLQTEDRRAAAELALAHNLTFYDASYVAIARRMGRTVLSVDRDLVKPGLASTPATVLG